ncbi:N-acetyltransferase domain-containing protein [Azospirillaceae bacterium]|nr:hypothetical protein MTCCP1_00048 [uncultured bacterium]
MPAAPIHPVEGASAGRHRCRPAVEADETLLRALYHQVRGPEFAMLPPEQRRPLLDMQYDIQRRAYALQFPGAEFLVIECDGVPAGRLVLHAGSAGLRVVDIAIDEALRGRGIGRAVLARLQDRARAAGTGAGVFLSVRPGNPARRLYEHLGFRVCGGDADGVSETMVWHP